MDNNNTNGLNPGVSVRMGPVDDMDVDPPATTNGSKRKSSMNGKSYKDATESEDDDDAPLVRHTSNSTMSCHFLT